MKKICFVLLLFFSAQFSILQAKDWLDFASRSVFTGPAVISSMIAMPVWIPIALISSITAPVCPSIAPVFQELAVYTGALSGIVGTGIVGLGLTQTFINRTLNIFSCYKHGIRKHEKSKIEPMIQGYKNFQALVKLSLMSNNILVHNQINIQDCLDVTDALSDRIKIISEQIDKRINERSDLNLWSRRIARWSFSAMLLGLWMRGAMIFVQSKL